VLSDGAEQARMDLQGLQCVLIGLNKHAWACSTFCWGRTSIHGLAVRSDGAEQACMGLQYILMELNKFLHVSALARSCNGRPDDR